MKYRFEVQGSAAEPYVVIIARDGNNLTAICDCPAGSNGQYCKHRFSLLEGSSKGVVGGDIEAIPSLPELLSGTDVEDAIFALKEVEAESAAIKKKLSSAKKAVAKAMFT